MIINMISGPRNMSTALMYSFAQHKNIQVIDEPFYAYYLKKTGIYHPGREETLASMPSDLHIIVKELFNQNNKPHHYIKNMAHHLILLEDRNFMREMKNIFLIRDPAKLIASFSRVIKKPTLRDIGIKDELELFDEVSEYQEPIIIDSDIFLKNPKSILSLLFKKLGLPFDENMLRWEAGPRKEDGVWAKYWYESVHKSTGFAPYEHKEVKLEGYLKDLYEKALPYYEKLYKHILKA